MYRTFETFPEIGYTGVVEGHGDTGEARTHALGSRQQRRVGDMARNGCLRTVGGIGIAGAIGAIAFQYLFRPWAAQWGTTLQEVYATYPGDELIPAPKGKSTHAITIHAPAAAIWPWLVQLGQGRGGFYSYDCLENLFGLNIHSANEVAPELQDLKVGDIVRMHAEGGAQAVILNPERDLVMYADPDTQAGRPATMSGTPGSGPLDFVSTWALYLRPIDANNTRLIARSRGDWNPNLQAGLMWGVVLDPVAFIMSRKMLHGIKERAERAG